MSYFHLWSTFSADAYFFLIVNSNLFNRVCNIDTRGMRSCRFNCKLLLASEIDECASNPCQNNGTCTDLLHEFYCNCSAGFKGSNCEIGK